MSLSTLKSCLKLHLGILNFQNQKKKLLENWTFTRIRITNALLLWEEKLVQILDCNTVIQNIFVGVLILLFSWVPYLWNYTF
jgi:hypothetical protein